MLQYVLDIAVVQRAERSCCIESCCEEGTNDFQDMVWLPMAVEGWSSLHTWRCCCDLASSFLF